MKLLFFDVETTGLNHATCAIHQLSGLVVVNGEKKESFNYLIKPHEGAEISEDALNVSGLNKSIISLHPSGQEQYAAFVRLLSRYINRYDKTDKFYLVGFNSRSFDEPFLRAFFNRHDGYYGSYFWQVGFDVMVLSAEHLKHDLPTMPNFKLATVATQLGIAVDKSRLHDAMYDVDLTYSIYQVLSKPINATSLARKTLATLDQQQRYFIAARKGDEGRLQALDESRKMEKELRTLCESITSPNVSQSTLF